MKKFFTSIIAWIFLLAGVVYASSLSGTGTGNLLGGTDGWEFNKETGNVVQYLSPYDEDYNSDGKKRIQITGNAELFTSEAYGREGFKIEWEDFYLQKMDDSKFCDESLVYKFVGSVRSADWGITLGVDDTEDNYFCASTGAYGFSLSDTENAIGLVSFSSWDTYGNSYVVIEDPYGNSQQVDINEIFRNENVDIRWVVSSDGSSFTSELGEAGELTATNDTSWVLASLNQYVDRNIAEMTRGLLPDTDTDTETELSDFSTETLDLYYYNFTWLSESSSSHMGNSWKILTIGTGGDASDYDLMPVTSQKTLIVQWGNVYINADIQNASDASLLTIIVKRDKENPENGGNVYINPKVTNIDAVIIADGSVLSYNGSDVLSGHNENDKNALRRQLLIYGAVKSANMIGKTEVPYGADEYWDDTNYKKYDFSNLRTFKAVPSEDIQGTACTQGGKIVAINNLSDYQALEYAFAGKPECYLGDSSNNLRTVDSLAPLVITYNPRIQLNPPRILQKP